MIGLYHYVAIGLFAGFALLELIARGRQFSGRHQLAAQGRGLPAALSRDDHLRALVLGRLARRAPPVRG